MDKKKYFNKRKLKCIGNCISKKGESYLHPISLQIIQIDEGESICPSKFHYDDSKKNHSWHTNCQKETVSIENIRKFMVLPYLSLSLQQFLETYKIYSIDDLTKWIDDKINNEYTYEHINRILNVWIKQNFSILISNSNILTEIYFKIFKNYWKIKINDKNFNKETSEYVKNWIKEKDNEEFEFNLGNDLKNYLSKKYGSPK